MAIELIDEIIPKNNGSFRLLKSEHVEMPGGERLSEYYNNRVMIECIRGSFTLSASGWSSNKQSVAIDGVTDNHAIFCTPGAKTDRDLCDAAGLFVTGSEGMLTFTVNTTPLADINLSYFII